MVIGAFPFSVVMVLQCIALVKAIWNDSKREKAGVQGHRLEPLPADSQAIAARQNGILWGFGIDQKLIRHVAIRVDGRQIALIGHADHLHHRQTVTLPTSSIVAHDQ